MADLTKEQQYSLEKAVKMRAKSSALEREAKELKDESNSLILPIMAAFDLKTYTVNGIGKATIRTSKGSSVNAQKARENMLIKGVDSRDVDWILRHSTKTWETEYVEFKAES